MAVEKRHRPIYTKLENDPKNPFHYLDIRNISKFKLFIGKNVGFLNELGKKNIMARDFQRTYLSIHDKYTTYDRYFENEIESVLFTRYKQDGICIKIRMKDLKRYTIKVRFVINQGKAEAIKIHSKKNKVIKRLYLKWRVVEPVGDLMDIVLEKKEIDNFYIKVIMDN